MYVYMYVPVFPFRSFTTYSQTRPPVRLPVAAGMSLSKLITIHIPGQRQTKQKA